MDKVLLEMKNIKKNFGSTRALDDVDIDVKVGEVHMLLGENGAGKSTLMKILAGSLHADSGRIIWNGQETNIKTPALAHTLGIGMVYQELALIDQMRVFENVLMGQLPRKKGLPFLDWKKAKEKAKVALSQVGLEEINIKKQLVKFNLGVRQLIEIAKELSRNTKLLILDEPTSALTESEVDKLFDVINNLKSEGVSFIFITHKLEEVFRIGDRVTIFRDGKKVGKTRIKANITEDEMIKNMVGRTINEFYPKEYNSIPNEKILEVQGLSEEKLFRDVSFSVNKGEVVGIAGLIGSGRTEIAEAIFGLRQFKCGKMIYEGEPFNPRSPQYSLKKRIGLLTKDRKSGLLLHMPIYRSITLSNIKKFVFANFFRKKALEIEVSKSFVDRLRIVTNSVMKNGSSLSGGNQQKVVISKLLCADCRMFIMDDPTRGIDIGAKVEVYKLMNELTKSGCGIIFISSEMPELLGMSDRILVARGGTIVADLDIKESSQEIIMKKISGGTTNGKVAQ